MLREYLKLSVEHRDLASRVPDQPADVRYEWFATNALFTAESLWGLVGDDPKWEKSIDFILHQHRGYLVQGSFRCDDFTQDFVTHIRDQIQELKCAP